MSIRLLFSIYYVQLFSLDNMCKHILSTRINVKNLLVWNTWWGR